jgi:hypothetical protein
MALLAGFLARIDAVAHRQLHQRRTPIPAVFAESGRGQKIPGDDIGPNNPHSQEENAKNLGWHLKEAAHAWRPGLSGFEFSAFTIAYVIYGKSM